MKPASEGTPSTTPASAALQSVVVKSEAGTLGNKSVGQANEPKQESKTDAQRDGNLGPGSDERKRVIVQAAEYFDDDYYDHRYEDMPRGSSPCSDGGDFTACSADDCGYCGKCLY